AGIELGKKGEIRVNEHLQTSQPHVYAAGDVICDPRFVYVAAYAGTSPLKTRSTATHDAMICRCYRT
ncbi:MAG: FAD-dependent oxidoreductase, partial [Acidobacteria bacterium]|nr:FAD-dependent oxidoreductase [Acidobacteriota bacterium]